MQKNKINWDTVHAFRVACGLPDTKKALSILIKTLGDKAYKSVLENYKDFYGSDKSDEQTVKQSFTFTKSCGEDYLELIDLKESK